MKEQKIIECHNLPVFSGRLQIELTSGWKVLAIKISDHYQWALIER
jgi:hypothetical protein